MYTGGFIPQHNCNWYCTLHCNNCDETIAMHNAQMLHKISFVQAHEQIYATGNVGRHPRPLDVLTPFLQINRPTQFSTDDAFKPSKTLLSHFPPHLPCQSYFTTSWGCLWTKRKRRIWSQVILNMFSSRLEKYCLVLLQNGSPVHNAQASSHQCLPHQV